MVIVAGFATTALAQSPPPIAPQPRVTIGYVEIVGDPRYEPITGFGRLVLRSREHPVAGAQVALDEAQALTRVLKTDFALERISVTSPAEVAGAVLNCFKDKRACSRRRGRRPFVKLPIHVERAPSAAPARVPMPR